MNSEHVLVFDLGGEYGHFRKFNTTTSPLTYSIPPRTALIGMIGAILGIERELGVDKFKPGQTPLADLLSPDKANLAVQIINPVSKVKMAFNLLNTKSKTSFFNIENRTQIEFELIKNPKFRVFLQWNNKELFNTLQSKLEQKHTDFTVCLGLSQFLVDIAYIGNFEINKIDQNETYFPVITTLKSILLDSIEPIKFDSEFRYVSDTLPVYMTSGRLVKEYAEYIFETNGKPIIAKSNSLYQVESLGNIQFL